MDVYREARSFLEYNLVFRDEFRKTFPDEAIMCDDPESDYFDFYFYSDNKFCKCEEPSFNVPCFTEVAIKEVVWRVYHKHKLYMPIDFLPDGIFGGYCKFWRERRAAHSARFIESRPDQGLPISPEMLEKYREQTLTIVVANQNPMAIEVRTSRTMNTLRSMFFVLGDNESETDLDRCLVDYHIYERMDPGIVERLRASIDEYLEETIKILAQLKAESWERTIYARIGRYLCLEEKTIETMKREDIDGTFITRFSKVVDGCSGEDSCSVCMTEFKENESVELAKEVCVELKCGHKFHAGCVFGVMMSTDHELEEDEEGNYIFDSSISLSSLEPVCPRHLAKTAEKFFGEQNVRCPLCRECIKVIS